jgi:HEPN domain/Nucleotidyltransferase domain
VKTSTERGRRKTGHPDKTIVADIVRRVVEAAQPDKIILFGSAARGEMGPNSDIDFLVIKRERSCLARKRYPPTDPRERLNRARSNLALAKSDTVGALLEDLCFEAQQAAEKAVKAVFVHRGARFPYIHDLDELLERLERSGLKIPKYVRQADELSPFAVVTR